MRCAWDELVRLLPVWMRNEVNSFADHILQELRLRIGLPVELVCKEGNYTLTKSVKSEDIHFIINAASRYSPWTSESIASGYITAAGGHRIGICGEAIVHSGEMTGIRYATSLCIRVARDFVGIANRFQFDSSSILIIGAPGSGKTTLLRDLIRRYSDSSQGSISVLDERGEIFPAVNGQPCFPCGKRTDILTNCSKVSGVQILLRTMGPACIAVDEITKAEDCNALSDAIGCGVKLIATAHAGSLSDLKNRSAYRLMLESNIFHRIIIMQQDKSWIEERM